jgi:predicted DCC family thiol-disulfide oxidoreductase YuxK
MDKIKIFYDGTCGLCHSFVRFTLSHMRDGDPFLFSPQGGIAFKAVAKDLPQNFTESIVVYEPNEKRFFFKAEAIALILCSMNSPWRGLGLVLKYLPSKVSNFFYNFVARIRHKLFKKPSGACPIVPQKWRAFFEE